MPLVDAKCTNCGAALKVDKSKEAAICEYCGSAFIVEKAISNHIITNNINAGVVNVFGNFSSDFEVVGGNLKKYNGKDINVNIPDGITAIGERAFTGLAIESVTFSDTVREIRGDFLTGAFSECNYLKEIIFPKNIQIIGHSAFSDCKSLKKITFMNNDIKIESRAFINCESLEYVFISNYEDLVFRGSFWDHPFYNTLFLKKHLEEKQKQEQEDKQKQEREQEEQKRIVQNRMDKNLCKYCGSKFKGVFSKFCSNPNCKKPKDY